MRQTRPWTSHQNRGISAANSEDWTQFNVVLQRKHREQVVNFIIFQYIFQERPWRLNQQASGCFSSQISRNMAELRRNTRVGSGAQKHKAMEIRNIGRMPFSPGWLEKKLRKQLLLPLNRKRLYIKLVCTISHRNFSEMVDNIEMLVLHEWEKTQVPIRQHVNITNK